MIEICILVYGMSKIAMTHEWLASGQTLKVLENTLGTFDKRSDKYITINMEAGELQRVKGNKHTLKYFTVSCWEY